MSVRKVGVWLHAPCKGENKNLTDGGWSLALYVDDGATDEQFNAFVSEAQTAKNAFMVTKLRLRAYKTIPDQLDQLYHDITAGKLDATGEWYKAIKKVKDDNPKS